MKVTRRKGSGKRGGKRGHEKRRKGENEGRKGAVKIGAFGGGARVKTHLVEKKRKAEKKERRKQRKKGWSLANMEKCFF